MSKIEHNGIYYDPHNEIVCDKLRLKEFIEENETLKNRVTDLEAKLAESEENCFDLGDVRIKIDNQIKQLKEMK